MLFGFPSRRGKYRFSAVPFFSKEHLLFQCSIFLISSCNNNFFLSSYRHRNWPRHPPRPTLYSLPPLLLISCIVHPFPPPFVGTFRVSQQMGVRAIVFCGLRIQPPEFVYRSSIPNFTGTAFPSSGLRCAQPPFRLPPSRPPSQTPQSSTQVFCLSKRAVVYDTQPRSPHAML